MEVEENEAAVRSRRQRRRRPGRVLRRLTREVALKNVAGALLIVAIRGRGPCAPISVESSNTRAAGPSVARLKTTRSPGTRASTFLTPAGTVTVPST